MLKQLSTLVLVWFTVTNLAAQSLPARMYADSAHAPFLHGVASGDPLDTAVIIWTRITPPVGDFTPLSVYWEMSADSLFSVLIGSGMIIADSSKDFTVKVDVGNLSANSVYYYRFHNGLGQYSLRGRTRTAPTGAVSQLRFAIFSCSSIYSGYFNAYARVAERADTLNAAIHVGDYIYDFVDAEEQVRVPAPYPTEPANLAEWRDRHDYYLFDPDLRAARAALPWIVLWDNHDQECGGNPACAWSPGKQAFYEWQPVRVPDTTQLLRLYRKLSYGNMADIIIADALMYRRVDTLSNGEYNMLGTTQYQWLTQELLNSTAQWKLVASQRMVGGWYTDGIPAWLLDIVPNNGPIFDDGSWDGFPATKEAYFQFLRSNFINNVIMLSGDAHVSIAQDLVEDPHNSSLYDPVTGLGSVGVEFLPTSITRGNLDESGAPVALFDVINNLDLNANPQHQLADLYNHGFGYLHLQADSSMAQFWYSHKLWVESSDSLGATLYVKDGENHWSRNSGYSAVNEQDLGSFTLFPNPAQTTLTLQLTKADTGPLYIEIINQWGQICNTLLVPTPSAGNMHVLQVGHLAPGMYYVRLNNKKGAKFLKL